MLIDFLRASPSGNNTILVLSSIKETLRPAVCEKLLALHDSWAEQLGFVSCSPDYDAVLEMSGGEFCGNASLSLASYITQLRGLESCEVVLCVSGVQKPVRTFIQKYEDFYLGRIEMPAPEELCPYETELFGNKQDGFLLRFPGICHIILDSSAYEPEKISKAEFSNFLDEKARELKTEALGLIFFNAEKTAILPLVFVREVRTLFLEKSCASGTAALASYLAYKNGRFAGDVFQEGGVLRAEASFINGRIEGLFIENKIRLFEKESLELDLLNFRK